MTQVDFAATLRKSGLSAEEIAEQFDIGKSIVKRWMCGTAKPEPKLAQKVLEFIARGAQ